MIFYLSGLETDDLLMVLEGVEGAVVKRSAERKKRKYFEKGARKDSMGAVSAKVFISGEIAAEARDIVVEGVRAKQVEVVIKGEGDVETVFVGPNDERGQLQALADLLV